jgi:hypothetical protein
MTALIAAPPPIAIGPSVIFLAILGQVLASIDRVLVIANAPGGIRSSLALDFVEPEQAARQSLGAPARRPSLS